MIHWAAKYVGTRYVEGARGPDFYDCWGIIQLIYREQRGIVLPELPGLSAPQLVEIHDAILRESTSGEWRKLESPTEGCIVAMGNPKYLHHVGVWVNCDNGKVLHCRARQNTVVETLRSLRLRGFTVIHFYQHHLWPGY